MNIANDYNDDRTLLWTEIIILNRFLFHTDDGSIFMATVPGLFNRSTCEHIHDITTITHSC